MRDPQDDKVIEAMLAMGGHFIQALARAFQYADAENQARLRLAFKSEWLHYAELAQLREMRREKEA